MSAVASQIQWDPPAASSAPAQDATKSADIHWDQPAYDTTRTEDVKWEQDHPLNVEFNRALAAGNSHLATLTSLAKNDEDFAKIAGVMVDRNFSNMPYSGVLPSVDPETLQAEKIHGLDDPRYRHAPQWDTALELLGKNRTGDLATMTPSAFGENAYKALSPEDKRKFIENLMVGAGATPQAPTPAMVTPDMKLTAGQNALEKFVGGITGSARLAGIPTPAQAIGDPQLSQLQGQIQEQGAKENPVTSFTAGMAGAMLDPGMRAGGGAVGKAISPLVGESQGLIGAARAGLPAVAKELGRSSLENAAFGGGVEAASQLKSGQLDPQAIFAESLKQGVLGPVFHSTLGTVTDAIGRDAADHAAVNALVQNGMDRGMAAEAIRQWRWADDVIRGTRQTPEEQSRQAFQERQATAQANMPGQGAPAIRPQDIHWDQPEPLQETPNAVQKPSPEGILQRQPEQTGEAGGGRGRVEQGQQGQETPQAGQSQAPETPAGHAAVPVSDQGSQFGGYPVDVSPLAARRATDAIESGVTNAATREMRQTLAAQSDELGARADQARQQQSELEATKARVRQVGEDKEAFASLMQQQREQRIATYTPERLAQMDGGQLRAAADDLGVAFDAPSTTVPRILDAIQRRSLEAMSNKQLYDEAQKIVRENGIARVKPGTRETNIQLIQAWRNGRLQSNWTPDQPRTTVPEGATLPPQQSPPPPASATANEPASPTAQLEPNRDASAAPVAPQAIHTPERNASEPPVAAPAKPEAEHTAESLSAMTPREVAGIAKDMGLKVGTKAANVDAILGAQRSAVGGAADVNAASTPAVAAPQSAPEEREYLARPMLDRLNTYAPKVVGSKIGDAEKRLAASKGAVIVKPEWGKTGNQNQAGSVIGFLASEGFHPLRGQDAGGNYFVMVPESESERLQNSAPEPQPGPAASEPPSRAVEPTPVAGASGASGGGGESTAKAAPEQPKIFGFGGAQRAVDPNASTPPEKPNVSPLLGRVPEGAILPKVADAARGFVQSARWLRDTFAPQTASDRARSVSEGLREAMATAARNEEQVKAALAKAHWFFDGRTQKQNRDFIDRFQAGEQQPTPQLQAIADAWKSINRDQTDRMDQLDPEMKRQWEENHIKQVWKESAGDPGKVGSVVAQLLSKRPLEGSKGFLKQKSYLTYKEGREAGLTPLYENPVDAMMHGFSEAEKFIQMRKFANQLIHSGVAKFVRAGDQVPDGMKLIDDPAFTVYLPPTMAVNEYVNRSVHDALQSAADKLGVRIKTVPSGQGLIRGSLGTANSGTGEAIRRFGTDIGVLAHEVGHQLDFKYGLSKEFLQPKYAEEMRALADLYEPDTPSQQRYVRRGEEKIAAMLDAYMTAPEAFRHAAPTVYERFQDFLASHDETAGLADFERTLAMKKLTTELPRGGITKAGAYAVPEDMAGVIGNHLSRGLKSNPIFKGYMSLNNGMNQVQLAGAFHAGFTSADAIISRNALALEQLARGKPWESVKSLVTSPLTPFTNAFAGHQLISEYLRPGTHPELSNIVNALVEGGARIHQDSALQSRAMSKMVRAFRQGNLLEGVLRLPVGIMDAVNRPLMEHLVPMQKWGVMGDLMREELDKLGPDATHEQVRTAARKVVDTVDNRMGQIVYDNLFMNRKAKDLMMAGMRSVGWNLGTVKEVGGGFASLPKNAVNILRGRGFSSHSAAYVLSLLGTTAAAGALYNYLATGQYPQTLQDFYQPRTGRKDENGDDVRVQLPTYMRDVAAAGHGVDWDHPGKIIGNLADMAASKVAPLPAALMDLARNKDYFGVQIANPDESLGGKTIDRAKFLAKQAEPFSITGMQRMGENATPAEKAEALIGVTPVPKRFTQTQAEQVASDIMDAKYGGQTRTAEQASASQYRASLVKQLKADPENGKKAIAAGVAAGRLTDKQAGAIAKQAGQSALQWHMRQFSATEALKVLDAANPEEKNAIENIVRDKIVKADMSRGEQDALFAQHGIKPPADLAITREHEDLNKKEKADTDRTSQINALDRQIAQADQNKDWNKGAKLRQQQAALRDQPKMTAAEAARLKALREYVRQKNLYEQRVKEGTMTESEGAAATQKAMDRVVSPAP